MCVCSREPLERAIVAVGLEHAQAMKAGVQQEFSTSHWRAELMMKLDDRGIHSTEQIGVVREEELFGAFDVALKMFDSER